MPPHHAKRRRRRQRQRARGCARRPRGAAADTGAAEAGGTAGARLLSAACGIRAAVRIGARACCQKGDRPFVGKARGRRGGAQGMKWCYAHAAPSQRDKDTPGVKPAPGPARLSTACAPPTPAHATTARRRRLPLITAAEFEAHVASAACAPPGMLHVVAVLADWNPLCARLERGHLEVRPGRQQRRRRRRGLDLRRC
jgi:hypothetical protein